MLTLPEAALLSLWEPAHCATAPYVRRSALCDRGAPTAPAEHFFCHRPAVEGSEALTNIMSHLAANAVLQLRTEDMFQRAEAGARLAPVQ